LTWVKLHKWIRKDRCFKIGSGQLTEKGLFGLFGLERARGEQG
jgi:hypothetical protein